MGVGRLRYRAAAVILAGTGCHLDTIPPNSINASAMVETQVRIGMYYQQHGKLPANLDVLPVRNGYVNRIDDAWHRPLHYVDDSAGAFSLSSLGRDGVAGGVGDDADLIRNYHVADGKIVEMR